MSSLERVVSATLDPGARNRGFDDALELVRRELDADRISLHAISPGTGRFCVLGSAGSELLRPGTELPLETSTQVRVPADGQVFLQSSFDRAGGFDHPLDRLVTEMGYRSGCSIPLSVGRRAVGAACLSSRAPELGEAVVDVLMEASGPFTMALLAAETETAASILVCHRDELVAEGVARILEHSFAAHVEVVTSPDDAVERVGSSGRRVDKVVCDGFFAEGDLRGFLADLRSAGVRAPTLVVDPDASPLGKHLALESGADGYVGRDGGVPRIVSALRALGTGAPRTRPTPRRGSGTGSEQPDHLTAQESKLLLLLDRGLRFRDIAGQMGISESTAKGYARNVFAKLGVHSRGEAVHQARRQGILALLQGGATTAPVPRPH